MISPVPQSRGKAASASFVVTTTIEGQRRSQIWHSSEPLSIGFPFRWVIERTEGGVRVRDVSTPINEIRKDGVHTVTDEMISRGEAVEIDGFRFEIRPVRRLAPAPLCEKPVSGGEMHAYTCVGNWLMKSQPVETEFTAVAQLEPVFKVTKRSEGYQVSFAKDDVRVAGPDGSPKKANASEPLELKAGQLALTTFHYGPMTWRFAQVASSTFTDLSSPAILDEDARQFRKSMIGAGVSLALLFILAIAWPKPEPKEEELIPEQFAKVLLKPSTTTAAAPAVTAAPSSAPKKAADTAVAQAFRAKALQSAVSGLLKGGMTSLLAQSDFVSGRKTADSSMFNSKNKALKSESGPRMAETSGKKVAALGGTDGKGGVGYAKGEGASVDGQGTSLISMDTGASEVAEGLTKDEVGEVIHRHLSEVRYCYESAMLRMPDIEGKLQVAFTIGGSGSVKTASVKQSTLPDPRLDDCIIRRLVSWKFPKPKGGIDVSVTYPFIFKTLGR